MAMFETEDYWLSYLRQPNARRDLKLLQKLNIKENASNALAITDREREELRKVLLACGDDIRRFTSSLIAVPSGHQLLYSILQEEKQKFAELSKEGTNNQQEILTNSDVNNGHCNTSNSSDWKQAFEHRLRDDVELRARLEAVLDTLKERESELRAAEEAQREVARTLVTSEGLKNDAPKTWRDIPQDELAERLSKGEIIGREEWVPGISKGRRKLNAAALQGHLEFGERIHKEANEAFAVGDLETALTRYTQGVRLYEWVEAEDEAGTHTIDTELMKMLKNQSLVALKLGHYQEAKKASTDCLKLDEHDGKARFRRAKAAMFLGELVDAKNDLMFILKSPFTDTDAQMAARQGLRELRGIVSKWTTDVADLMQKTTKENTFSSDRQSNRPLMETPELPHKVQATPLYDGRLAVEAEYSKSPPENSQEVLDSMPVPRLSAEETMQMLEDILDAYTRPETEKILNRERREADFVEKRILIRLRKLLPDILGPVLDRWGFEGADFRAKKMEMERCATYWRLRNEEVAALTDQIYKTFLGDLIED